MPADSSAPAPSLLSCFRRPLWIGLGLFLLAFASILGTVTAPGFAWDEVFYIGAAENYRTWFRRIGSDAMKPEVLREFWQANKEHPPLAKLVIAAAMTLGEPVIGVLYSARMVSGFLLAALVLLVFLFMKKHFDPISGVLAALSLLLMPHVFGHAHFAELDLPMAFAWFACAAAFSEAVPGKPFSWAVSGLVFGLALLTKINALAIPPVLSLWGLFYFGRKALPACISFAIGIPVFFAGWPWLWTDTLPHLQDFMLTLKHRNPIPVYYFGRTYGLDAAAPFHYPLVMTLATLPAGTALAAALAAARSLRSIRSRPVEGFLLANAGFILLSASMPGVPKYDGVRLFLPAFPFLACLAGMGLRAAYRWLTQRLRSQHRAFAVAAAYFLWLAAAIAWMHPFYLSYYGGLAGGVRGAHSLLGMESTYWSDVVDEDAVQFIVDRTPPGGSFVVFPYERLAMDLILKEHLKKERPDIREEGFDEGRWDVALLNCRQGMFNEPAWELYRNGKPAFAHRRQGVPLCLGFINERKPANGVRGEQGQGNRDAPGMGRAR